MHQQLTMHSEMIGTVCYFQLHLADGLQEHQGFSLLQIEVKILCY